jgi:hypothetical protein
LLFGENFFFDATCVGPSDGEDEEKVKWRRGGKKIRNSELI